MSEFDTCDQATAPLQLWFIADNIYYEFLQAKFVILYINSMNFDFEWWIFKEYRHLFIFIPQSIEVFEEIDIEINVCFHHKLHIIRLFI